MSLFLSIFEAYKQKSIWFRDLISNYLQCNVTPEHTFEGFQFIKRMSSFSLLLVPHKIWKQLLPFVCSVSQVSSNLLDVQVDAILL